MQSFKKYISESPELDEGKGKPGLWANIHAKRKRGERPAKPGEEGYPKTLDIEESGKGYQPGWMLKKDPELAKKLKDKIDLAKKRQASYGNPAAGKSVKENKDEHDINSLQKHFGPAVAYDAASHGPAMMKRKDISGKSHTLIKQSNGKYKSVKEDKDADDNRKNAMDAYAKKQTADYWKRHAELKKHDPRVSVDYAKKLKKESVEQLDEVKVGDVLISGGKNITAGVVKKIEGDDVIVHHRPSNTLHRVSKKSISPSNIVKEELELDEAVDPSEIAGNPKAYGVDTVKKAYYHKKASTSDKESLARHLDRYHGHKEWRKPLVKEETVLQELSKETLGSYKHKAELSIPKDDREYKNRSKGIDYAEKKLKKESVELDEMTQGKSYTQDQLRKKMQSGNWEATHDIKPGKHVEMRHHTGKRVMVHVKEDVEQIDELSKKTIGSYVKKAANSLDKSAYLSGIAGVAGGGLYYNNQSAKRVKGIEKATDRLTKESVEQLDELSPNLLHRYIKKSSDDMGMHAVDHGKYGDQQKDKKSLNKAIKRSDGIVSASGRLADKANRNESEINDITAQYINENNITLEELENMTEAELNELIGKAIGGAFKLGAKAAVGATRLAGKAINRMTTSGRADAAEKKASTLEKKNADRERIRAAQDRLRKAKEAASKR